nr:hypothetical protein [PVC group bacterium]
MILSIDFGSTNFKSALFDEELNRMGAFSLSAPYIHNDGSRVEMDADTVRETLVELIENCCQNAGVGTESITTFAAGSQAQNFTVLDESGNARYPVISWLDTRSSTEAEELWKMYGADWHKHYSFSKLNGSMRLAHLLWLYRNKPQIFDDDYQIVTLPGLLFEMVGGVNLTDNNLEAMNGLYSLLKKDWRLEPIKECGITSANLPKCVPVGSSVTVESNCSKLKLRKTITLVSAGNDQTAGAFGNGCQVDDIIAT